MVTSRPERDVVVVAGGSGFVGSALVGLLARRGYAVRSLARHARRDAIGPPTVALLDADVGDERAVASALEGARAAFYLVHSLGSTNFEQRERRLALRFARAARRSNLERLIFVGALGASPATVSRHFRSRWAAGAALREAGVPVSELRASVVIGAGSVVFQMIRSLCERLPVLIVPKGADTLCQPIALDDLLRYLLAALEHERPVDDVLDVGGDEIVTYDSLVRRYAAVRGLRRLRLEMPIATPRLSGAFLRWIASVPPTVTREFLCSLGIDSVARDRRARQLFGIDDHIPLDEAIHRAIAAC
jgi:uncharacterized protein YbjT (DUF2867 family)